MVCLASPAGIPSGVGRHVVLAAVVLLGIVAGCDDGAGIAGGVVTGELAGRQKAELEVVSGSDTVVVRAADLGDQLFRASALVGSRVAPVADVTGSVVRVSLTGSGGRGAAHLVVELNDQVHWRIRLDGGAKQATVGMTEGRLTGLDLGAGNARIEAGLPVPRGTVPVRMAGGASVFDLRLPRDIAAQVRLTGGAGSVTIDGTVHTGVAGGTVYTPNGWNSATNRYLIDNTAGVSSLTLDRTRIS